MDNSNAFCIIGIIVIIALVVLAIVASQKQKKKREEQSNILHDHLKQTGFIISNSFKWGYLEVVVDTEHKMLEILDLANGKFTNFKFSEIIECETIEDGNIIASGGIGRAIVGGVLAGGVGALVGASTRKSKSVVSHLAVKITRSDINNPLFMVELIKSQTECASVTYKVAKTFADQLQATCTSIIKQVHPV